MNDWIKVALEASMDAGQAIMEVYGREDLGVEYKGDSSPLTLADKAAHEVILEHQRNRHSSCRRGQAHAVSRASRLGRIVDCGSGRRHQRIHQAQRRIHREHRVGSPRPCGRWGGACPCVGSRLRRGGGRRGVATGRGRPRRLRGGERLVHETVLALPSDTRPFTVVASRSHMSPETEAYVDQAREEHGEVELISKGSSLKLCMVAEGTADAYPRFAPTMEWDTAAGQAVCEAAGCDVVDQNTGQTMRYNREELLNAWFLVSRTS